MQALRSSDRTLAPPQFRRSPRPFAAISVAWSDLFLRPLNVFGLLDDDAATEHLHPALIGQRASLARRQGDSHRLVERELIALIETREHDLLRTRLIGLAGH